LTPPYAWLCRQRRDWDANADVWHLRAHWPCERKRLLRELRRGTYRFEPVRCCRGADGHFMHLWASRDAVVLKALTLRARQSL
jgi:RNA-directed DNA polymerase